MIQRSIVSAAGIVFLAASLPKSSAAVLEIRIVDEKGSPLPARST